MIDVRIALAADIFEILPLLAQLGYPTNERDLKRRFDEFLHLDGYGVLVASQANKIVGVIAWSKSKLFVVDKARFHIEGLIVDEEYRGKGIGQKLVIAMEEFLRNAGPSIIDLTSGLRRAKDGTHEFYKRLGYNNEGLMAKIYLRKDL